MVLLFSSADQLGQDVATPDVGLPLAHSIHQPTNGWPSQPDLFKVLWLDIIKVGQAIHLQTQNWKGRGGTGLFEG